MDTIVNIKSKIWYSVSGGYYSTDFVSSKVKYFVRQGLIFSHTSEMNITFISDLRKMTNEHYLQQSEKMLEWKLNAILAKNPELI